jgi:hypothetical protein
MSWIMHSAENRKRNFETKTPTILKKKKKKRNECFIQKGVNTRKLALALNTPLQSGVLLML